MLQQVAKSSHQKRLHQGLFQPVYRETTNKRGSELVQEGTIWTCCREISEDAPGCKSFDFSPHHLKCSNCGKYYLPFENSKESPCRYHKGKISLLPESLGGVLKYQCCSKKFGSEGCEHSRHIPFSIFSNRICTTKSTTSNPRKYNTLRATSNSKELRDTLTRKRSDTWNNEVSEMENRAHNYLPMADRRKDIASVNIEKCLLESSIKELLIAIRDLYILVIGSTIVPSVIVESCKKIVNSLISLESRIKMCCFTELRQHLDVFRKSIGSVIRGVQNAMRDERNKDELQTVFASTISSAKEFIDGLTDEWKLLAN